MGTYCITCKNNECDNRNKPIYFGLDCEKYFNNGYINADRIREMNDEEATVTMVDSNIQREEILPSEKAFAYKMKLQAMKKQGQRNDLTSAQNERRLESADILGAEVGESRAQVRRYIRLTELIPELLQLVDSKQLQLMTAVEISYLDKTVQKWLDEYLYEFGAISVEKVKELRIYAESNEFTKDNMMQLLKAKVNQEKTNEKIILKVSKLKRFFPVNYTAVQMERVIMRLLENWEEKGE